MSGLRDALADVLDYYCETRQYAEDAADAVLALLSSRATRQPAFVPGVDGDELDATGDFSVPDRYGIEALRDAVAQAMAAIEELQRLASAGLGTSIPKPRVGRWERLMRWWEGVA